MTYKKSPRRKIHHTKRGARFVWRKSKYTGKMYKQYLPRITQHVSPTLKEVKGLVFVRR